MTLVVRNGGGSVTVSDGALNQIVLQAAEAVEGVRVRRRPRRHVSLDLDRGRVELGLTVAYGQVLPTAVRDVQERVTQALGAMCGVAVRAVDVTVEEVERG